MLAEHRPINQVPLSLKPLTLLRWCILVRSSVGPEITQVALQSLMIMGSIMHEYLNQKGCLQTFRSLCRGATSVKPKDGAIFLMSFDHKDQSWWENQVC